uniref:Uncharacterized protein n=1 Tax=Siphoviridae sp. ct1TR2 TaxID=2825309 RepID=A0A8S5NTG1_9CAUD|nr:MAG TPA: hypothetical protein [Siphoviridae sp. ct1TR2]
MHSPLSSQPVLSGACHLLYKIFFLFYLVIRGNLLI